MPLWPKGVIPRCRGDALAAYCMLVNCGPAKGCCLPDIDRHRRGCARGTGGGKIQNAKLGGDGAGGAVLSPRFAIGSWLALRSCRRALPSAHVRLCVPVAALCLGSRLSFSSLRKKRRLAVCSVSVPPGRDRHSRVLQCRRGYLPWQVHFGFGRFFMAIPTG